MGTCQLSQPEIDALFERLDERRRGEAGRAVRFSPPGPYSKVAGARYPSAAHRFVATWRRAYRPTFARIYSGESGQRGPTFLFRVSRWFAFTDVYALARAAAYDGKGVLVGFPILEMVLGGNGKASGSIQREITEIEQKRLDGLFRFILNGLREAWRGVTEVDFTIESMETEPQRLPILAPNEAVVAIGVEARRGDTVGMMNIADALDSYQDDAAETRPAMVGAQNDGERSRAGEGGAAPAERRVL